MRNQEIPGTGCLTVVSIVLKGFQGLSKVLKGDFERSQETLNDVTRAFKIVFRALREVSGAFYNITSLKPPGTPRDTLKYLLDLHYPLRLHETSLKPLKTC